MAINLSQAFHRTSANAVDETLTLTKAQMLATNDNLMPSYYFTVCQDDGKLYLYDKSATPNSTTGKFKEFSGGNGGSGIYSTSATLTTVIGGTTNITLSTLPSGLTPDDIVVGGTLVYDQYGSLGVVFAMTGTNLTIETTTAAPGERRGVRLGAVNTKADLPATTTAATALGWQSPIEGDYVYVRQDETHDNHLTEWVITAINMSTNAITWGYSHTLNAGDYVVDIYKSDGTLIPKQTDGTVKLPEFGTIKGINDASGTALTPSAAGIITLPTDENTTYTYVNTSDGFRVTNNDTGGVFIHQDLGVTLAEDEHLRSSARSLFVDGDNGDDTDGDGSLEHPFKNIQRAINELRPIGYRLSDLPGWGRFDTIYVNCSATDPYEPVYFEKLQPVTIYSYDPSQSYISSDTGANIIYNNSLTATLRITSNPYPRADYPTVKVHPNAWYQRESIVYLRVKNVVIIQNAIATAVYVGCASLLEHGDGNNANYDKIAYTFSVTATKNEAVTFLKLNPATGKNEPYTTPTTLGCEGIGCHERSRINLRGYDANGGQLTINASNWGLACSTGSQIYVEGKVNITGGSNVAGGNYGAIYVNYGACITFNHNNCDASHLGTETITSNGKSNAISASDNGCFRTSNNYVKCTIQQTRTDCVSPTIAGSTRGCISITHGSGTYTNIIGKTAAQRTITAWGGSTIIIAWPASGTSQASNPTNGTQQCIAASEGGRVFMYGGSGSTLPAITGKVGYAAYNGGQLTYANIGKFTGTTQRAAGSGGRIYTGNQSSMGNY